jgi:hypothetical protein
MSRIDTEKLFHEYWSKASLNIGPYGIGGSDVQEGFEAGFEAAIKQRDEVAKKAIDAVSVMEKCLRSLQLECPDSHAIFLDDNGHTRYQTVNEWVEYVLEKARAAKPESFVESIEAFMFGEAKNANKD